MGSSPQESEASKQEKAPQVAFQPLHTAWSVLSSPWTLAIASCLLAGLLVAAANVEQGLSFRALLTDLSFAQARVLDGLGANNVWTGWITVLLALTATLSLIGLLLRYRLRFEASRSPEDSFSGPLVSRQEAIFNVDSAVLWASLEGVGVKLPPGDDAAPVTWSTRGWVPAGALLVVGAITLLVSLAVDGRSAMRAQVDQIPTRPTLEGTTRMLEDGEWVERQAAFKLRCSDADPGDLTRQRTCLFHADGEDYRFSMTAGEAVRAGGYRVQFKHETPVPMLPVTDKGGNPTGQIPIRLLLRGDKQQLIRASSGERIRLEDGRELALMSSPDGPLVVIRSPDKPPQLLAPRAATPTTKASSELSAIPDWRVTTEISRAPGRVIRYVGWGFGAAAILFLLLWTHLGVAVIPVGGGGFLVILRSYNRPGLPAKLIAEIREKVRT